jgi:putative SOS response-associated peptidase YedK
MCARYTLRISRLADVAAAVGAEFTAEDEELYKPRYNVALRDLAWVLVSIADRRVLRRARWNYLNAAKRSLTNIRSETLAFGRFRDVFDSRRCAVVADGFYVWPGNEGEPVWFHASGHGLLLLGGLLQPAKVPGAPPRFSVFTTRPNAIVAKVHDRMPVILSTSQLDDWLTGDPAAALSSMLSPPAAATLVATNVSRYVNDVKHDDPGCVTPRPGGILVDRF